MKIGISVTSSHSVEDPREGARNMIERARASRDAGLDTLFVGDHHVTPFPYYQNNVMLARMLAEWGDKPYGALYLLPLWHPVTLAEQIGTLASQPSAIRAVRSIALSTNDPTHISTCSVGTGEIFACDKFQYFDSSTLSPRHMPRMELMLATNMPTFLDISIPIALP